MGSKSLQYLTRLARSSNRLAVAFVVGTVCALCVPILILIVGNAVHILVEAETGKQHAFAPWLPSIGSSLPETLTPLAQVSLLLVVAVIILSVAATALYSFYRQLQSAAVAFEVSIVAAMRDHSKQLAVMRTLSAQQTALVDGLEYHLPRIRTSLTRWWRTFPRHLIHFVSCLIIAFLIQPLLTLLIVVGALLVTTIYRQIDRIRRSALPVVRERASQRRSELLTLCLKGPLLESVHAEREINVRFGGQLADYEREAVRSLSNSAWKTPLVVMIAGILGCGFLFIVAVQILRPESTFSIAGALTFLLAGAGAAASAVRLQRSARELRHIDNAADELVRFLSLPVERFEGKNLKAITRVTQKAELDHVTLQDSSGRKLLENVSLVFNPGRLIGIVASERIQAQALVELLMGYGRPVSGRMLVDGELISDLTPESLSRCSLWVSPDGPLITATVQDNLTNPSGPSTSVDLNDILRASKAIEVVQQLPDGLATLITPGDDRLTSDTAFRLGIARANLRSPSIVVIEEPDSHVDSKTEQDTIDSIRSLVKHDSISVLLPHRLQTVRQCDVVVLIHEHKVADIGTHSELLQRSELYRHLNYVRFNPFRNLGA
jgi:ATP-binding cassette, subfamily B, bacterial